MVFLWFKIRREWNSTWYKAFDLFSFLSSEFPTVCLCVSSMRKLLLKIKTRNIFLSVFFWELSHENKNEKKQENVISVLFCSTQQQWCGEGEKNLIKMKNYFLPSSLWSLSLVIFCGSSLTKVRVFFVCDPAMILKRKPWRISLLFCDDDEKLKHETTVDCEDEASRQMMKINCSIIKFFCKMIFRRFKLYFQCKFLCSL